MNLLKLQYARNYKIIFQKNKMTKGVNIHIKNTETFPKKKKFFSFKKFGFLMRDCESFSGAR